MEDHFPTDIPFKLTQKICAGFIHPSPSVSRERSSEIAEIALLTIEAEHELPSARTSPDRLRTATSLMLYHISSMAPKLLALAEADFPKHTEKVRRLLAPENTAAFGRYAQIAGDIVARPYSDIITADVRNASFYSLEEIIGRSNHELANGSSGIILPPNPGRIIVAGGRLRTHNL